MEDYTSRMAGTLGLVLAVDLAFAVLGATLLEPWSRSILAAAGLATTPVRVVALTGAVLLALLWAQLEYTRRELLASVDAERITAASHPALHARVTRLAKLADHPVPDVAVADVSVPNSFAMGGIRSGTVVVSRGLLETLPEDELEAVLAHELVHLKNRDAAVMTLASFLPALVSEEFSPLEDRLPDGSRPFLIAAALVVGYGLASAFVDQPFLSLAGILQFVVAAAVTVVVGGILLGLLATPVVFLARRLSRAREFVADRDSARIAGDPAALASALARLDDVVEAPSTDPRTGNALEGMCLLPHGFDEACGDATAQGDPARNDDGVFHVETRSHPPTEERIDRLRAVYEEFEAG